MTIQVQNLPIEVSPEALAGFCKKWQVRELALFGSVLRPDFSPDSDVDVLVSFEEDAPWSLWHWGEMLQELRTIFGRDIDLIEKEALKNPIRKRAILNSHRVIYAA